MKHRLNERQRDVLSGYAFILPAMLFMVALIGYPIVYNILISFQNFDAASFATGGKENSLSADLIIIKKLSLTKSWVLLSAILLFIQFLV